jgi:hypothetical protein
MIHFIRGTILIMFDKKDGDYAIGHRFFSISPFFIEIEVRGPKNEEVGYILKCII